MQTLQAVAEDATIANLLGIKIYTQSKNLKVRGGKWYENCDGNSARDDTNPYPQAVYD